MILATFNGNPSRTVFSCPTSVSDEMDLIVFYNEISSLVRSIPKHNVFIFGGDIHAQIGKNVHKKFSLHNLSDRIGDHLTGFTLENRLTYVNTKFQKRKRNLWTYIYVNNTKAQIDYILINKKWNNYALIVWHIPLQRVCRLVAELSVQRYDWANEGMRPEQPQPYTITVAPAIQQGY